MQHKSELRQGDILILKDTPDNTSRTHKLIKLGQRGSGFFGGFRKRSSSTFVHALMWVLTPGYTASDQHPEIAEASGSGSVRGSVLKNGFYKVFRPTDENLGDWAAQAALNFASSDRLPIGYSKIGALNSLLHSGSFGKSAKKRVLNYSTTVFTESPMSNMFCSEFVVVCYQAAAGLIRLTYTDMNTPVLKMDAKHITPASLYSKLSASSLFSEDELDTRHK